MSNFMDFQEDVLDLISEEDIIYADGLNIDQELSYVAKIVCPFSDFNFLRTFLSKVKF